MKGIQKMKIIESKEAPGAVGPYSQGFITNGLIFRGFGYDGG